MKPTLAIDTGAVTGRRTVRLFTVDDLDAEVGRIVEACAAGRVRSIGNWSPAQVVWHIGRLIEFSFDGFPFQYPWLLRWAARLLRVISWRWLLALAFRPGFRNPTQAAALEPDPALRLDEAVAYFRVQMARVRAGEQMTQPSPVEGLLSHDQWVTAHLRHAELHLSFLAVGESANAVPVPRTALTNAESIKDRIP